MRSKFHDNELISDCLSGQWIDEDKYEKNVRVSDIVRQLKKVHTRAAQTASSRLYTATQPGKQEQGT